MDYEFKIRRRIDKSGNNSIITLFFELLAIFGIVWVGLFIFPLFLGYMLCNTVEGRHPLNYITGEECYQIAENSSLLSCVMNCLF